MININLEPRRINTNSINDQRWIKILMIYDFKKVRLKCKLDELDS